jgi:hypothetical protein
LIGFVLGVAAGVAAVLYKFRILDEREDRPVIRVKNRDVTFEANRAWKNVFNEWHMDPNPLNYYWFVVTIEDPPGSPDTLEGRNVFIECKTESGDAQEFEIHSEPTNGRKDPKLRPSESLDYHGSGRKLKMKKVATITRVRVPGSGVRPFDGKTDVSIKIEAYR